MKSFSRVLRLVMRRRWSLAGILISSLVVASLWGANIATMYPLVEVVFKGDGLPQYAEKRIGAATAEIVSREAQIADLESRLAGADEEESRRLRLETESHRATVAALEQSTRWLRRVRPWIDAYAPRDAFATLLAIVVVLLIGTTIKLLALAANMLLVQAVAERTAIDLRSMFFRKALQLDLDAFGDNGSGQLTARLTNDVAHVSGGITVLLGRLVREPLKMAVCLAGAALICWRLLLLVMVLMPLVGLVMHHLSRSIRRASRRAMEEMSQLYSVLNDAFAGIRVVKAFNAQSYERARFRQRIDSYYGKSMKMAMYNTLARGSSEWLGMSVVGLAILAGGYLVLNQQTHLLGLRMSTLPLDVTEILMFFGFLIGASDPAKKLSEVWSNLQRGIAGSQRVFQVIDQPVRVREPAEPQAVPRPHRELRFDGVRFRYACGPEVLRGVDLSIRHGETIAIVGPNGCGKSTLLSLLCRFDDPQDGRVLLDRTPIDQMRIRDLRRRIALVTQRTVLFDDTIENNIAYGMPGADAESVAEAARMAYADDFIRDSTTSGYQTVLGGDGMRLSGGQMQRLALARAFLRRPDILILDEATSQIDSESEQLIHRALSRFLVGRTGILITHRPSGLALADRVVVMDGGKIADQGRHDELLARNRFYRSLCGSELKASA